MNNKTIPWVEKFRPTKLNDIVLDPYNKVNSSIEYIKMFRPQVEPNIGFIQLLNVRNVQDLSNGVKKSQL